MTWTLGSIDSYNRQSTSRRDVRQAHDNLQILAEYRIVHFREEGGAKKPHIPYDTVKIEVELSKSLGDPFGSPASA